MKYNRFIKKILGISLVATLAAGTTAYAAVEITPLEAEASAQAKQSGPGVTQTEPDVTPVVGAAPETSTGDGAAWTVNMDMPTIQSEGAVLLDAATGKVLFGKNEHTQYYPASITKIMTALLVLENCSLDQKVTFSKTATTNLESGSVSLSITEGDVLTVEQSLYGLILKSANEIGNGLAEHVSGSVSAFADKMNERAKALGCENTNFINPHGLNDDAHKTTPYDMALIARAAFANETFRKIDTTLTYEFPATNNAGIRTITMGHKMLNPSDSNYYEGIIGGKTGYTSKAGNTLVTGAEKNGIRLVAVVMKSSSTHYADTKKLLDYGFANYQALVGTTAEENSGLTQITPVTAAPDTVVGPGSNLGGWKKDSTGWYYERTDGSKTKSAWLTDDGNDYWLDANGYMVVGWHLMDDGDWYYFRASGAMARDYWVQTEGSWFYLGANGAMLKNTITPDEYWVNEAGIWVDGE